MKTPLKKEISCLLFTILTLSVSLILPACTFPILSQATQIATVPPTQDSTHEACYFNWANEALPDLSKDFADSLKIIQPQAMGYAEAYGEDCINQDNEVVYFVAMETDFFVTLKVENLEDKQALGELIEQVYKVVAKFPIEDTPGPQPGYVGITFQTPGDELRLWLKQKEVETALENGLQGEELFDDLQTK